MGGNNGSHISKSHAVQDVASGLFVPGLTFGYVVDQAADMGKLNVHAASGPVEGQGPGLALVQPGQSTSPVLRWGKVVGAVQVQKDIAVKGVYLQSLVVIILQETAQTAVADMLGNGFVYPG